MNAMMKQNCWQFKECGREPGGNKSHLGICPAAQERSLDGEHGGKNGGRACWVVTGTLCDGATQGSYATKYSSCRKCGFYDQVWQEEKSSYVYASILVDRLK